MQIPTMTDDDKERFLALVPDRPDVTVKPMFGNLGAFVNGAMFMGAFGSDIGVKLSEADREELLGVEGSGPFGPPGRPMGGYVSLPPAWLAPSARTADWVQRAVEHVASLPPRAPAKRKARG